MSTGKPGKTDPGKWLSFFNPDFACLAVGRQNPPEGPTNENTGGIFIVLVGVSKKICHAYFNANFGINYKEARYAGKIF